MSHSTSRASDRRPTRKADKPEKWLKVGLVGRAHGIRGDFFIVGREEPLDTHYTVVRIGSDPGWGDEAEVEMIRNVPGGKVVMRCDRSKSRNDAEELTGRPVWVLRAEVDADPETEYVWGDLLGRPVVDADGFRVGHVLRIYNAGASDILVVRDEKARGLEIPVAPTYLDPGSLGPAVGADDSIRLIVSSSLFADLWQDQLDS